MKPITHLIIDTTSSDSNYNCDCDYCLVPMSVDYILYLLDCMDLVRRLHRSDEGVFSLECWDSLPVLFRDNRKLGELATIDGTLAGDVPLGEPILLEADPQFSRDDIQQVECQSVQILSDDVWWSAHVRHTSIRIETAHIEKRVLLRILKSLGGRRRSPSPQPEKSLRQIHDLLYQVTRNGRKVHDPEKPWDADTLAGIAEIVGRHIPRPGPT